VTGADVRREERDGVLTVTFTRYRALNAVSDAMIDVLAEAVADLGDRVDLRVLVVTAEGRYFTAGIDVSRFGGEQPSSGVALRRRYRRLHQLLDEIEEVEKPVVHAAQGPCLGLGVELAASCDLRFATSRTRYQLPEIANLAVVPGSGGISRLARLVGPHWTTWMAMAGEAVDAELGVAIGLVHRIFPEATFAQDVQAAAARLAGLSAEALGLAKLAVRAALHTDRTTARDIDRMANTLLLHSDEHRQAVQDLARRRR